MTLFKLIASDYKANPRNWKGFLLLALYRFAHAHLNAPVFIKPFSLIYLVFYKIVMELFIGTEIHWRATIGEGARLYHGYATVINSGAVIGKDVQIRHCVTIGEKEVGGVFYAPVLGDHVNIGVGAILLGKITIGDHAVIGAGAVVVKDIPAGATVVGNPARIINS